MKKQERLSKKKRKAAALAQIIEINEDGKSKAASEIEKFSTSQLEDEPVMKKIKQIVQVDTPITDEQYKELRKDLAVKRNALKNKPLFRLKTFGDKALLSTKQSQRQPLMLDDIQHLLMYAMLGASSPYRPDRWCVFEKASKVSHTVVLVVEGVCSYTFMSNESRFEKTKSIFEHQMEVLLPNCTKSRIVEELCFVPLTQAHKEKLIKEYGSLEAAIHLNKEHHLIARSVFPIEGVLKDETIELCDDETFPRTRLLLSPLQMMIEGYPMPLNGEFTERYREFQFSRKSYTPVTNKSPMFGVDCEMCRTTKAENELARVSIVDENYESVYETLVRPTNPIVDYLTAWSGITKEMMSEVTKTLKEVQEEVQNILPADAILVGQSLNCDLSAMKLMHPYVIDTSVIFNISGDRNRKSKLQTLAKTFLGEEIQMKLEGHSSIEDSISSLKLTKLKLSKDIYYGDTALQTKQKVEEKINYTGIVEPSVDPSDDKFATTILSHAMKQKKKSAIVTASSSDFDLSKFCSTEEGSKNFENGIKHHKEASAKSVVTKTREIIVENDFNLSHVNIFEEHEMHEEEKMLKSIDKLDSWIQKIWDGVAQNGLFVVILGGNEKSPSGVSMVRIKN